MILSLMSSALTISPASALPLVIAGAPRDLVVFGMATLPILELRGAIPYGLGMIARELGAGQQVPFAMIARTYIFAVLGNFVPVIPILLFLEPVSRFLRRVPAFDRFFTWLFARTRRRGKLIERYEAIGLTLFVAIPLPVTGAWTGAMAAFIFGIRLRPAVVCITLGILIAGVVVTLASMGVITVSEFVR